MIIRVEKRKLLDGTWVITFWSVLDEKRCCYKRFNIRSISKIKSLRRFFIKQKLSHIRTTYCYPVNYKDMIKIEITVQEFFKGYGLRGV